MIPVTVSPFTRLFLVTDSSKKDSITAVSCHTAIFFHHGYSRTELLNAIWPMCCKVLTTQSPCPCWNPSSSPKSRGTSLYMTHKVLSARLCGGRRVQHCRRDRWWKVFSLSISFFRPRLIEKCRPHIWQGDRSQSQSLCYHHPFRSCLCQVTLNQCKQRLRQQAGKCNCLSPCLTIKCDALPWKQLVLKNLALVKWLLSTHSIILLFNVIPLSLCI